MFFLVHGVRVSLCLSVVSITLVTREVSRLPGDIFTHAPSFLVKCLITYLHIFKNLGPQPCVCVCVCACEFVVMHFIYLFVYFPPQRSFFFITFRDREREKKEGRERNFSVGEKHWWVASRQHPDPGLNPKPFSYRTMFQPPEPHGPRLCTSIPRAGSCACHSVRIPRSPIAHGLFLFPCYNIHLLQPTPFPVPQPCSHPLLLHLSNSVI